MKKVVDILTIAISTILICVLLFLFVLIIPKNKTANIIIVAGQSNAEGVAEYADLTNVLPNEKFDKYSNGIKNVKLISRYSLDNFVDFKFGLNEYKKSFGIELGIIDYFLDTNKNKELFIVKCAVGGTGLSYWQKGEDGYGWLSITLNKAIELISKNYNKINIKAMCWMQGESDRNLIDSEKYYDRLNSFVSNLREDYKDYCNFKFVDAGILNSEFSDAVNSSKKQFAESNSNNYYFDVDSLDLLIFDGVHYNAYSEYKLGYEFGKYCF